MSHFGPQSRSSLAPRAAWVIEGGHHRGGGRCVRPQRGCDGGAAVAGTLAGSLQSWRSCAIMLSNTGACGRAGKRAGKMGGAEKEIDSACSSSSAAWSGGFCRRSKLCNGSAARATLPAFRRAQSAKALYKSNRVAATTREACGRAVPRRRLHRASVVVASVASAPAAYAVSAASRRLRLRCSLHRQSRQVRRRGPARRRRSALHPACRPARCHPSLPPECSDVCCRYRVAWCCFESVCSL